MRRVWESIRAIKPFSAATGGVRIVERDGDVVRLVGRTSAGKIEAVASMSKEADVLRFTGLHIEGPGAGTIGLSGLRALGRDLGRSEGVRTVIIQGARRISGANAGRIPRQIIIRVR